MSKSLETTKQFSRYTMQPDEGFFPLTQFTPFSFHPTGIATTEYREENLHPGVVGLIVNSLIRFMLSGDKEKSFSFAFRTRGRVNASQYGCNDRTAARVILKDVSGINPETVVAARQLARHVAGCTQREGSTATHTKPPDAYTIACIMKMVEDAVAFFQRQHLQSVFSTFSMTERYRIVTGNEHSFVADNTLWKTHVSFREPDKKDILRLMATAILARDKIGVMRAGIVNVRSRKGYVCELADPAIAEALQQLAYLMRQTDPNHPNLEKL